MKLKSPAERPLKSTPGASATSGRESGAGDHALRVVPYTEAWLPPSFDWLNDEEIRRLTMTRPFTPAEQRAWFESLKDRADYLLWGIESAGKPIGAFGLKHIDGSRAEYWGYIGERSCWGRGIGQWMVTQACERARSLGLLRLSLRVLATHQRAIRLYQRCGFALQTTEGNVLLMEKEL